MKCWVCSRQARGYGHTDNRHRTGQAQRYPLDWVFCSERCQKAFHAMYGNWVRLKDELVAATLRYCPVLLNEPENRLAAMVDFTFNLGAGRLQTSTLRRRINQMDWRGAALELRKWVHGGGRVLPGLVARRQAEIALMGQSI